MSELNDDNFMDDEEMSSFLENLWERLTKEGKMDRIENLQEELYDLIGHPIEINILLDQFVEKYKMDTGLVPANAFFNEEIIGDPITVGELVDKLSMEEDNRIIAIDPIYLKDGLNLIDDMLLIDSEDSLIIVPKKIKENE